MIEAVELPRNVAKLDEFRASQLAVEYEPPAPTDADAPPPFDENVSVSNRRPLLPETNTKNRTWPRWRTASQICQEEPEKVPALAPYIVEGAITEFDAFLKTGKTTFVLSMISAITRGEPFLGQPTKKTPIVYLNEMPTASLREALGRAELLACEDCHVLSWNQTIHLDWSARIEMARAKAKEVGAKILVVDTLAQWAGISGDQENSAGHMMQAMVPLQAAQGDGLAVFMVRHSGKNPPDVVGKAGRGSSAVSGVADLIVELNRVTGGSPTQRVLRYSGRYEGFPSEMQLDYLDGRYLVQGAEAAGRSNETNILDALPGNEGDGISVDKILGELEKAGRKLGRKAVDDALTRLLDSGRVARTGNGTRGSAYKYHRKDSFLSSLPSMGRGNETNSPEGVPGLTGGNLQFSPPSGLVRDGLVEEVIS